MSEKDSIALVLHDLLAKLESKEMLTIIIAQLTIKGVNDTTMDFLVEALNNETKK